MPTLAVLSRLVLAIGLAALASAPAFAQFSEMSSRTVYVGSALNVSAGREAPQARPTDTAGAAPAAASAASGNEPVILDLTLYDDGFAYGRLLLPRRGQLVEGAGRLQGGVELRLTFDRPGAVPSTWQADFAHDAATTRDPDLLATLAETQTGVIASFSGRRDMDFGAEGRSIKGAVAFTGESPGTINVELRRFAQYSTWSFGQGRIHAGYTSPHLGSSPEAVAAVLEERGR